MSRQHHTDIQTAADEINRRLREAVAAGRFMIAVWIVDGDTVHCHRTTFDFPSDQMLPAAYLLVDNVRDEVMVDQSPLPVANFGIYGGPLTGTTGDGSTRTTTTPG